MDEPLTIRKLAAYIPVSAELLNPTPISDDEVRAHEAERLVEYLRQDARHAELLAASGVVGAVAELHSPDERRDCCECQNGDFMASWPCATWECLDENAQTEVPHG